MNLNRYSRSSLATAAAAGLMLTVVAGCFFHLRASQRRAADTLQNVRECREMVARIDQFKATPVRADLRTRSATDLARKIEAAAEQARLPRNYIVRIDPNDPRRVAETDYKNQATEVELRPVSLRQFVAFVDAISQDSGIQVGFAWLTSPDNQPTAQRGAEMWNAQLILSNLVFSPKQK